MFKLTSGRLVKELSERADKLRGRKVKAGIHLSEKLAWWYYQEFGTVRSYPISPASAKALRLPETAEYPEATIVPAVGPPYTALHGPLSPKRFVANVLPQIRELACQELVKALIASGYDPSVVQEVLMADVMPKILDMIADSMAASLGSSREGGKLEGQAPEEAYRQDAEIVDLSS